MILKDALKRLTYNYVKHPASNVYKIFKLFADELEEVKDTLDRTEIWRDIEEAEGNTLDLIGINVGQVRNGRTDEQYRQALLIAIARNVSGGDVERINEILEILLGNNYIGTVETWSSNRSNLTWSSMEDNWNDYINKWNVLLNIEDGEPAAVNIQVQQVPGLPTIEFLKLVVSAGIRVIDVAVAGDQFRIPTGAGYVAGQFVEKEEKEGGTKL